MPENSRDTIFLAAIEIEDSAARARYLEEACGEDAKLRSEIERLISAHEAGGSILDGLPNETELGTPFQFNVLDQIGPYLSLIHI